jgi:hypothetical protein
VTGDGIFCARLALKQPSGGSADKVEIDVCQHSSASRPGQGSLPPITSGQYLRQCREEADLSLHEAAAAVATLPWAVRRATHAEVQAMALRLVTIEEGGEPFTLPQLELIASAIPLDPAVYVAIVQREQPQADAAQATAQSAFGRATFDGVDNAFFPGAFAAGLRGEIVQ